ncbi:AcrR family transcriptional regulator [Oceanisphaera litoralis]|uniref:TetR/AcrR family transcriptional regulator n=1 Tax=Oceanisphaera litoralis TaxID=225144 RepID=UPI00195A0C6A|nr:TetR/AcrR family transcriptional regulator [Oceanisphaera litoralis]MBM7454794.1 AcrR family transcriptional regulator [Oceanisphaera litoralis]
MKSATSLARAQARAREQRTRILDAARRCFIRHGFHGASMAELAKEAQMSPGLIYRYFDNKHHVVLAIIAQQLQLVREEIGQLHGEADLLLPVFMDAFGGHPCHTNGMSPSLFLEISAEASRDPTVATAVRDSDLALHQEFSKWLTRPREQGGLALPTERAGQVMLIIQCLWEGLLVRQIRDPELDAAQLKAGLTLVLPLLLQPATTENRDRQGSTDRTGTPL